MPPPTVKNRAAPDSSPNNVQKDKFRILLTTDTHIGYKDKDKIRGNDSFDVFEEILYNAKKHNVDFMLHCGDFFDEHKPSRNTMYETIKLLRKYCLGEGNIGFEVISDPNAFRFGMNYMNPNVRINLPIFVIHGNHDDPGEEFRLSPLDLLEASNLVNYFGRAENLEDIQISPVLLKKGETTLALYGLGWIRDERIHHAFQSQKVKFSVPEGVDDQECFHLMLIHQNRFKGNSGGAPKKNCVHESMLPDHLDFVLWGHEHDCFVKPEESVKGNYYILQLGSSIQTSLSPAEALKKHIALIEIKKTDFKVTPIELLSVRPFGYREIRLSEMRLKSYSEHDIWECLKEQVEELLAKCKETTDANFQKVLNKIEGTKDNGMNDRIIALIKEKARLPLIRLKVDYTGCTTVNIPRFGAQFIGKVANPADILLLSKKRDKNEIHRSGLPSLVLADSDADTGQDIHDIIFHFLDEQNALDVLPEPDLNVAVQDYVVKMDAHAISNFVRKTIQEANKDVVSAPTLTAEKSENPADILAILRKRTDHIRNLRLNSTQPDDKFEGASQVFSPTTNSGEELSLKDKAASSLCQKDAHSSSEDDDVFNVLAKRSAFGSQIWRKAQENSRLEPQNFSDTSGRDTLNPVERFSSRKSITVLEHISDDEKEGLEGDDPFLPLSIKTRPKAAPKRSLLQQKRRGEGNTQKQSKKPITSKPNIHSLLSNFEDM